MDKIIGITNAPDDVIAAGLSRIPISVLAHGKYVGGHVVIYEDSQQIASGDLINGQDVGGTGTYAYSLTPIAGYSGYDDAKSYRLVIDGDEINLVSDGVLTNLPFASIYIIADLGSGMQVMQTRPNLSSVSVSQTKTVTTKKYQAKKLDKSLLPDGVESGIEAANTALARTVQNLSYDKTEGYFSADGRSTTALNGADMPDGVFCARVYVGNHRATAFLHKSTASGGSWFVGGFAVTENLPGEILYVGSSIIPPNEAKGLFLTFMAPDSMLLKSSTSGSNKRFRITVDDTGTLKATEVTDA